MSITITLDVDELELLDRALMEYGRDGAAELWYRLEDARGDAK